MHARDDASWLYAAELSDLVGGRVRVCVGAADLLLICEQARIAAVDAHCPHAGYSLERGRIARGVIECPAHRWRFDLRTGAVRVQWWARLLGRRHSGRLRTYRVMTDGERLLVRVG